MEESSIHESEKSPLREKLVSDFQKKLDILERSKKRDGSVGEVKKGGEPPLITVVTSLWEETDHLLAIKMFEHSLSSLVAQAKSAGANLDIIICANNGGANDPELGNAMRARLDGFIESHKKELNVAAYEQIDAVEPTVKSPTEPWKIQSDVFQKENPSGGNRILFVNQTHTPDGTNAGKIRAIRDVSNFIGDEMLSGYSPDVIFQIDAETILKYKDGLPVREHQFSPLKVLLNQILRGGKVAVGTKDRFELIDEETGKPTGKMVGSSQEGYMDTNKDRFITLPGGALMAKPEIYVAGMSAIAENVPGVGTEDYLLTKMLGYSSREIGNADSIGIVTHLNRARSEPGSYKQLLKWFRDAKAVDKIFPENPYRNEPFLKYFVAVLQSRLKTLWTDVSKNDSPKLKSDLRQLLVDIKTIPDVYKMLKDGDASDIFNHVSSWSHGD